MSASQAATGGPTVASRPATRAAIELDAARSEVLRVARELRHERKAAEGDGARDLRLAEAIGRVLAEDVRAPHAVPPFAASAMDGYAVRAADVRAASDQMPATLAIAGESQAGHPFDGVLGPGQATVISTGAVLPEGADAVVRVERTREPDDGRSVEILESVSLGCDARGIGDDISAGALVLAAGCTIGPAEVGVLASLGIDRVRCARRPVVRMLSTGDELLAPGLELAPGKIFDSNRFVLAAMAERAGAEIAGSAHVRDDRDAVQRAIATALSADVAVICGGISVGRHDHVQEVLQALGVREHFHGVALKPGKPAFFGVHEDRTLVFALPGNPVSAVVTFVLFAGPALRVLGGAPGAQKPLQARLACDYKRNAGRTQTIRCSLRSEGGELIADPAASEGSHIMTSLIGADGLAFMPRGEGLLPAGELVDVEPLAPWLGFWR